MTDVTMIFKSTEDDVKIAESIANHINKPVVIRRTDGTRNHVIPIDTGTISVVTPLDTAPALADDDAMRVYFNEDDGA